MHFPRVGTSAIPLPEARLASNKPIRVTVPAPPPITEEELIHRFNQLAREHAQVREREPGEAVELGDEVQVDIIGYAHQKLIPFSIRSGMWLELAPQEELPGFSEALAGSAVGDCVGIDLVLPESYPVASLRGVNARFMVDLVAARERVLPEPDSEEFLRELGRGSTLPEVMDALAQELLEERSREQWVKAQNAVLDVLASRLEVTLPAALIDEEIRQRWVAAEGPVAEEKNFSPRRSWRRSRRGRRTRPRAPRWSGGYGSPWRSGPWSSGTSCGWSSARSSASSMSTWRPMGSRPRKCARRSSPQRPPPPCTSSPFTCAPSSTSMEQAGIQVRKQQT